MVKKLTTRPFSELEARMSKKALEESDRIYAKLRREMALHEVRAAVGLSQKDMAERLKVDQAQISRVERRGDARVSTLDRYVRAAGGRLRLIADMPGHRIVELVGFGSDSDTRRAPARAKRA